MRTLSERTPPATSDTRIFDEMESRVRLYCRRFPVVFAHGRGAFLYTEDGRSYLDLLCAAGALNYGHNHPYLKRRLLEHIEADRLTMGLDLYTTAKREFLERFRSAVLAPRGLDYRVQFCGPTGANAVEAALKLARRATGRTGVVSFAGAFHGMSQGAMSVSGALRGRAGAQDVVFVPYEDGPYGGFDSVGYLERAFGDPASGIPVPAAVIVEPVQLDGGVYPASPLWLQRLRALTARYGIELICDEIQVGCGRTGPYFCFETAGIVPDIVLLSKSLSGYGLPMSVVLLRPELDVWEPGEHTGTFRGNQLAFVTAAAALDLWEQPGFAAGVQRTGAALDDFAAAVREREPSIVTRGRGPVLGLDLAAAGGRRRAAAVQRAGFEGGLVFELCGRDESVIKLMPPLTVEQKSLVDGLAVLRRVLAEVPAEGTRDA